MLHLALLANTPSTAGSDSRREHTPHRPSNTSPPTTEHEKLTKFLTTPEYRPLPTARVHTRTRPPRARILSVDPGARACELYRTRECAGRAPAKRDESGQSKGIIQEAARGIVLPPPPPPPPRVRLCTWPSAGAVTREPDLCVPGHCRPEGRRDDKPGGA